MLLTEEDARKKYCPFRREAAVTTCRASDCMGWRWERLQHAESGLMTPEPQPRYQGKAWGYCGLAGGPY